MTILAAPPPLASIVIAWGVFGGRGLGWYITVTMRAPPRGHRPRKTHGPFDSPEEACWIAATLTNPDTAKEIPR